MAKFKQVVNSDNTVYGVRYDCPGCATITDKISSRHVIPTEGPNKWEFNNNFESPTLAPSILSRWPADKEHVCHHFVRDGMIQYLEDCTHSMAGKTVPVPDVVE